MDTACHAMFSPVIQVAVKTRERAYWRAAIYLVNGPHCIPCNMKLLLEFNFADWRFFVFCGNLFLRMGKTGFSCWELIFAIFRKSPSIWSSNVVVFEDKQSNTGEQHALNQFR